MTQFVHNLEEQERMKTRKDKQRGQHRSETNTNQSFRVKAIAEEMAENRESETKEWIQRLLIVATLIAAVTIAGPLAIPGGVSSDSGIPVQMASAALEAFIIAKTLALCFSMLAVILCFHVHRVLFWYNFENRRFPQNTPEEVFGVKTTVKLVDFLVQCAFMSTLVSYSFGVYVLVAPKCLWLAITTVTAACAVPFMGAVWQIALFFKLIGEPISGGQGREGPVNGGQGRDETVYDGGNLASAQAVGWAPYVLVAPKCLWLGITTFLGAVWQIASFFKLI